MRSQIRDAGETLVNLLRAALVPDPVPSAGQIAIVSPAEIGQPGSVMISLFLYSIMPVAESRKPNVGPRVPGSEPPSQLFALYYLLTAHPRSTADLNERTLETHLLLEAAMGVFLDHPILTGSEQRLTYHALTVEDMTRIWSAFGGTPLRTSVGYVLSPVRLS
jgi:hypothetical protein